MECSHTAACEEEDHDDKSSPKAEGLLAVPFQKRPLVIMHSQKATRKRPTLEILPPAVPSNTPLGSSPHQPTQSQMNPQSASPSLATYQTGRPVFADSGRSLGGILQDQEFNQIRSLLEVFRDRHYGVLGRCAVLEQDFIAVHARLSDSEVALKEERNACSRLGLACKELQKHAMTLISRLNGLNDLRKTIQNRGESIEDLVVSLTTLKSELSKKIMGLEKEKATLEEKNAEMEVKDQESIKSLECQINALQKDIEGATESARDKERQLSTSRELSESLEAQLYTLRGELQEVETSYRDTLLKFDNEFGEYKSRVQDLVKTLSDELGCRPPASFGDGGIDALQVVLTELAAEHRQLNSQTDRGHEEEKKNLEALVIDCEQKLADAKVQLANLSDTCKELQDKIADLEAQILTKDKQGKKMEKRITEQQLASTAMAAKLASLQKFGVIAAMLNDVFEQEASNMEYEDMKLLLEEKLGHHSCATEIAKLKETLDKEAMEKLAMTEQMEGLKRELEVERKLVTELRGAKERLERLEKLKKPSASQQSSKTPTAPKENDKAVDELIELIEKDTQELKSKTIGRATATPPSTIRRSGTRGTTSSKFRKRSPVSSHSELDLWAAFSKR